jgi:hypothetical protein
MQRIKRRIVLMWVVYSMTAQSPAAKGKGAQQIGISLVGTHFEI